MLYILAQRSSFFRPYGEVAERLNAPHSKCGIRATVSGVRIPPSPPINKINALAVMFQWVQGVFSGGVHPPGPILVICGGPASAPHSVLWADAFLDLLNDRAMSVSWNLPISVKLPEFLREIIIWASGNIERVEKELRNAVRQFLEANRTFLIVFDALAWGETPVPETALLSALSNIGVVEFRMEWRINMPNIFRVAASIKRRGWREAAQNDSPCVDVLLDGATHIVAIPCRCSPSSGGSRGRGNEWRARRQMRSPFRSRRRLPRRLRTPWWMPCGLRLFFDRCIFKVVGDPINLRL